MSEYFFPKLNTVEAMAPYRLRTTWSAGEVLEVDVESVLRKHSFLAAICPPAGQDQPVNLDRRGRSLSEELPGRRWAVTYCSLRPAVQRAMVA